MTLKEFPFFDMSPTTHHATFACRISTDHESKSSLWTRDYRDRQRRLEKILAVLDRAQRTGDLQDRTLTDEQFQKLGIELFDLDFKTGENSYSVTRYFMPANNDAVAVPTPIDDDFTRYNKTKKRRVYKDEGRPSYLAGAFRNHAR